MLAGAKHAVAASDVAARDVGVGHRHDLGAQERADPADGAHEGLVLGAPALGAVVGPLDVGDDVMGELGEDGHGGLGGHALLREDVVVAVLGGADLELGGLDAALAGEAGGCLGGVSVGVEGDLGLGAAHDLVDSLGGDGHVGDDGGQAPR